MSTRIYIVTPEKDTHDRSLLIRANSAGQALRHATSGLYTVSVANTEQVASLVSDGVKVENAAKDGE